MTSERNLAELNKRKKRLAKTVARLSRRKSAWARGLEKIGWEKEKGVSWWRSKRNLLIASVFLTIVLGLTLVWIFFGKGIWQKVNCVEVERSFSVESSCNLNENEVVVNLLRDSDKINLERLEFEFYPSMSLWKVDGSKCLDVRVSKNKYGGYCSLVKEEEKESYVFNLSLGIQQNVKVRVKGDGINCELPKIRVGKNC